jgi:hypothetical protein
MPLGELKGEYEDDLVEHAGLASAVEAKPFRIQF